MKTLFVLLVGIAIGAAALYYYQQSPRPASVATSASTSARETADAAVAKSRAVAANVSDAISDKIQAWHLTPDDIKADLAKTGQVARQNAARAKEKVADVRIVAAIKAKYVLDRDLSANAINVDSTNGDVTLGGTVASENLVGKAVALALDTEGVHHVAAKLTVAAAPVH